MNKDTIIIALSGILFLVLASLTGFPNFHAIRKLIFERIDPMEETVSGVITILLTGGALAMLVATLVCGLIR